MTRRARRSRPSLQGLASASPSSCSCRYATHSVKLFSLELRLALSQVLLQDKRRDTLTLWSKQPVGEQFASFAKAEKAAGRIQATPVFWFDGDKIAASQTPEELDLDSDMVLDVRW